MRAGKGCCLAPCCWRRRCTRCRLSRTRGQGLVAVNNSSLGGYDFSKVTLDADITLSANLYNTRLGIYTSAPRDGSGADIDIPTLQFGRSNGTDAQRTVQISNPYFEFV